MRHDPDPTPKENLFAVLPPEWPDAGLRSKIRETSLASGQKVVVLDDDPTGTQTVHGLPVVTGWSVEALASVWEEAATTFYILTNSRRYPLAKAAAINCELARNLAQVARARSVEPIVVSRSDSTLRGHYPGEVQALLQTLEQELDLCYDGVVIVPFFLEGGRYTIHDIHWVQNGETLIPAAQTEFAGDPTFGYRCSDLREWVEEKTKGSVPAETVASISLREIRVDGPDAVAARLDQMQGQQVVVANAASYRDLEVLVWELMQAEARGKRFLFRTAASFVKVRGGIPDRGLLTYDELFTAGSEGRGGLTIAGSYVQRTTKQLNHALKQPATVGLELRVDHLFDSDSCSSEIDRVRHGVERELEQGRDVILYTSRSLFVPPGLTQLQAAQQVSEAMVRVLHELVVRPRYLIGKGGITSSDLATQGLGVRKAWVLGQIVSGVPVWRLGEESRVPGMPFVVFPGNVGEADTLAAVVELLRGSRR